MRTSTLALLLLASAAGAAPIPGLFNTGVDANGDLLGNAAVDPNYKMTQSPDAGLPGPDAFTLNPGFPVGPWFAEGPDSRWIGPQAAAGSGAPGQYRFETTFDLTGFDASTAVITGEWGVDNNGDDIILNGASTGISNGNGFGALTPFTINSGFVAGENTLVFVVTNAGNAAGPAGLRVKMTGTVEVPGEPPSILTQPTSDTVFEDEPFTLNVVADGEAPLSYQWQLDGSDIPGATSDSFGVGFAIPDDSGDYTVVVTNNNGTATSDVATISVVDEVPGLFNTGVDDLGVPILDGAIDTHYQIAINPDAESPDAIVHNSSIFPIVAGPWLANNTDSQWISPRFDTAAAAGGDYTYRISFDLTGFDPATAFVEGMWTSDNAGVDILINGTSTGISHGGGFGGLFPFRVEPGSFLSGLNTLEFVINNASAGFTGLRVEGIRAGAVPGTGGAGAPFIVRQPEDAAPEIGAQASFSVLADGAQPLTYQWRKDGTDLGGATGSTLTLFNINESSPGEYDVVVTNGEGSVTSDSATLTITRRPPEIITQPADQFAAPGEVATFSVVADGTMPITFQWRRDGSDIAGANSADLVIDPVSESDATSYDVVLTNNDGTLTSESATLTVLDRVPGIYSTGVNGDGIPLLDDEVDPHYTLTVNADGGGMDALAMSGIPSPPWVPNSATSRWIGPNAGAGGAPGLYTFQTRFDLRGFDPATVILVGQWTSDNSGLAIRLNGTATGNTTTGNFDTLFPFTIDSGFVDGINTLEFDVENAGAAANPIGLRVEGLQALGNAVAVPPFEIFEISYDAEAPSATFTWNSRPGENYKVDASTNLVAWGELDDSFPSGGETTTYTDTQAVLLGETVFYRVTSVPE